MPLIASDCRAHHPVYRLRWRAQREAEEEEESNGGGGNGGGGGGWSSQQTAVTTLSVNGLTPGANYLFAVQAYSISGWGPASPPATARTNDKGRPDQPSAPRLIRSELMLDGDGDGGRGQCTAVHVSLPPLNTACGAAVGADEGAGAMHLEYRLLSDHAAPRGAHDGAATWSQWRGDGRGGRLPPSSTAHVAPLAPLSAYEFRARAVTSTGVSDWSSATPPVLPGLDGASLLEAPRARALGAALVRVEWPTPAAARACQLRLRWRLEVQLEGGGGTAAAWTVLGEVAAADAATSAADVGRLACGPPATCTFRTLLLAPGWSMPSKPSVPLSVRALPPVPEGALRVLLRRRAPPPADADATATRWAHDVSAALDAPPGQVVAVDVSDGGGACVLDIGAAERWKVPMRLAERLVRLLAASALLEPAQSGTRGAQLGASSGAQIGAPGAHLGASSGAHLDAYGAQLGARLDPEAGVLLMSSTTRDGRAESSARDGGAPPQWAFERLSVGADGSLLRHVAPPGIDSGAGGGVHRGGGGGGRMGGGAAAGGRGPAEGRRGESDDAQRGGAAPGAPPLLAIAVLLAAAWVYLSTRRQHSSLLPCCAASPLKLTRFELRRELHSREGAPISPRLQPMARVVDLSGVERLPQLRATLLRAAAELPGSDGASADGFELYLCDAQGRRTRFTGRSMLAAVRQAHELYVLLGESAELSADGGEPGACDGGGSGDCGGGEGGPAPRWGAASGGAGEATRSLLCDDYDDDEEAAAEPGPGRTCSNGRQRGDTRGERARGP